MARYRAKPFEFEAVQWFKPGDHDDVTKAKTTTETYYEILTVQGWARVNPGDWIITLPDGESYPCKPDLFAAKYEPLGGPVGPAIRPGD